MAGTATASLSTQRKMGKATREAFGWSVQEINGNDMKEALAALEKTRQARGQPSVIIAKTVKGWPIQVLLPKDPNHHGKPLTPEEAKKALELIGA